MILGDWRYPIFVENQEAMIGIGAQKGGQSMDRTMTSTVRAGSVTAHVLRNDVLQQHIDVRTKWSPHYASSYHGAALTPKVWRAEAGRVSE
jgi:hypothetical protein